MAAYAAKQAKSGVKCDAPRMIYDIYVDRTRFAKFKDGMRFYAPIGWLLQNMVGVHVILLLHSFEVNSGVDCSVPEFGLEGNGRGRVRVLTFQVEAAAGAGGGFG